MVKIQANQHYLLKVDDNPGPNPPPTPTSLIGANMRCRTADDCYDQGVMLEDGYWVCKKGKCREGSKYKMKKEKQKKVLNYSILWHTCHGEVCTLP